MVYLGSAQESDVDVAALEQHVNEWQTWDNAHAEETDKTPPLGFVISMEGADPIVEPSQAQGWWDDGLRMIGLAHYGPSAYAFGTGSACARGTTQYSA